ncbi:MAG: penicillin acylase family protein [Spirosomataceae bacterium]
MIAPPVRLLIAFFFVISMAGFSQSFSPDEIIRLQKQAKRVTIIKDKYGVPHVYTKTDADAVFGMMYIQCEEFFEKVEATLINRLGRQAEIEGEKQIYNDLWTRMFVDSTKAIQYYHQSPRWLQKLCEGYANGINFYLWSHPDKKPKLINRVEPWICLMNNVPAMRGANITEAEVRALYGKPGARVSYLPNDVFDEQQATGSNGWAIAPTRTKNGNAMLLINPHSEFYGRIEIQLVSKQGLNVYGAPFLGQFNIFQGFNEHCGWMHPITMADSKDLYLEHIEKENGRYFYRYNNALRSLDSTQITIRYKQGDSLLVKTFTTYRTHHGPVVAQRGNQWVSLKTLEANIELLAANWLKTKSKNFDAFKTHINTRTLTGNNIIYADRAGNIAYWHGNFVPIRDPNLDWKQPVDGSSLNTEWQGTHGLDEVPHFINPSSGFVQNCNSTPLFGAGVFDTLIAKKPVYMLPDGHTPRAMSAIRLLPNLQNATIDDVIRAAHDTYLANGERFIPQLTQSYYAMAADTAFSALASPIQALQNWDFRADTLSVATTLAVLWMEKIVELNLKNLPKPSSPEDQYAVSNGANVTLKDISPQKQLAILAEVVSGLRKDFGSWQILGAKSIVFSEMQRVSLIVIVSQAGP